MNVDKFFQHHGVTENPFLAEEARHDPVFDRLVSQDEQSHPDFAKILGRIDRPSSAVVFGEKGSGKTAIRLLMDLQVQRHNRDSAERRTLLVAYDDLNPVLDEIVARAKRHSDSSVTVLDHVRLADHQDAILARAVTKLVSALAGGDDSEPIPLPEDVNKRIKDMPRRQRIDLAILAALYDQPFSGNVRQRWSKLCSRLKLGWKPSISMLRLWAVVCTLAAFGLLGTQRLLPLIAKSQTLPMWVMPAAGIATGGAIILWILWSIRHMLLWRHCRRLNKEMPAIKRTAMQLRQMLLSLRTGDLGDQPWPGYHGSEDTDSRYQLTGKLLELLRVFDYVGIMILVDRVDEPTIVAGQPDRMKAVVWPMLDNKFLQQDGVGVKLLLPVELSHMLRRESGDFFQEARLDKQSLVDPLMWSGATLYDLCSARLAACRPPDADPVFVTDLFEPEVSRDMIVDALDQMHQPRDAFKFLYSVIQEHCRMVPEDQPKFTVPRLTLDGVRRQQSQRVQEFYRGLTPA